MERYERMFKIGKKRVRASEVESWYDVIDTDPTQYAYIPQKNKTYALSKEAVQRYGWAVRDVPKRFQTEELVDLAIIEDCDSVCLADNPTCKQQVEAVRRNPWVVTKMKSPCDEAIDEATLLNPSGVGKMFSLVKKQDTLAKN